MISRWAKNATGIEKLKVEEEVIMQQATLLPVSVVGSLIGVGKSKDWKFNN